jgi:UDP-N-acetyl-D-mannosaminuronate dehydrogenase
MPNHVAKIIHELLYQNGVEAGLGKALLLGWSYKAEVGDPRETPAEPLAASLMEKGISVSAWDPHINDDDFPENITVIDDIYSAEGFDIAILVTAHKACVELQWERLIGQMRNPIFYDGRRVMDLQLLQELGWKTFAVGRPIK